MLTEFHDVTVLCADGPPAHKNLYRDAISKYTEQNGSIPGLTIVFIEQPPITRSYSRINQYLMKFTRGIGWQPLYYLGLDKWHKKAFQTASKIGFNNFDVVHQLTPISFQRPGYLWNCPLPFFWGPLGGMYKAPQAFARMGGVLSSTLETIRSLNIVRQTKLSRRLKRIAQKATRIWTITEKEYNIISSFCVNKCNLMIETAVPQSIKGHVRKYDGRRALQLCWSGSHEPRKALPLLFRAIEQLPVQYKVRLDILGAGPETANWQLMACKMGLENIIWHGNLPYSEALQVMQQADIFFHTSFREGTPHVILEALGWGLPVVCHDACGMAVAVNDTCGIKVPLIDPSHSIKGFSDALRKIFQHPELVEKLSTGSVQRATELTWQFKAKQIAEAYLEDTATGS